MMTSCKTDPEALFVKRARAGCCDVSSIVRGDREMSRDGSRHRSVYDGSRDSLFRINMESHLFTIQMGQRISSAETDFSL